MTAAGAEYGGALYELAAEEGLEEVVLQQLCEVRRLLAENQSLYLGAGKRCSYGMICFLSKPFPVTDVYFRLLV